jgi:hypothetical protein
MDALLDPGSLRPRDRPTEDEIRSLLSDAFSAHPQRYGNITSIANNTVTTDTNTRIVLDWKRLSLQQRGTDTDRIDLLYRIHYLQWTGVTVVDRILGPLGACSGAWSEHSWCVPCEGFRKVTVIPIRLLTLYAD